MEKAVHDANAYREKIEGIRENKDKLSYEVEAAKRQTAHMHKELDSEKDQIFELEEIKSR